jgi:molecular chaperone DnaK (HSP70)
VATVGFDFGTSTTMVASGDDVVSLASDGRGRFMPSVVGYDDAGAVVVGEAADLLDGAIRSIKRTITADRQFVRADPPTGRKDVRADALMIAILAEAVRRAAASGLKLQARGAVRLGCPAMWNGEQRRRMVKIANKAGLPVKLDALVDEPVAAGIAWLAGDKAERPERFRVVVFDMGGGTLDVAVLDVRGRRDVAVLAALGTAEAGDSLDAAIAEDLEGMLDVRIDALDNPGSAEAELRLAARDAKLALSTEDEIPVTLSPKYFGGAEIWYTRAQLEAAFHRQMDEAVVTVGTALRAAKLVERAPGSFSDVARSPIADLVAGVDVVVLAGGMAHVPYVRRRIEAMFGPRTEVVQAYPPPDDVAWLVQAPELAIAAGLARADHYGRINMYRPAFDIVLQCDDGQVWTLYEAYTPLMEARRSRRGAAEDYRYVRGARDFGLAGTGAGTIRVVSHNGGPVHATLGGRSLDGFPVALDEQKFELSLYPYGRIQLVDGGGTHEGQFDDWHII